MMRKGLFLGLAVICLFSVNSYGVRSLVGDIDGFGFDSTSGLIGFDGFAADRDGDGMLDSGDVLPDLDDNGIIACLANDPVTGEARGDNFDNRSSVEAGDSYARWTDVALSNCYSEAPGGYVWKADSASFKFTFEVPTIGSDDYGKEHFVNLVYGDYDSDPMHAVVEGEDVGLLGNRDAGGLDGYIWRAYAPVAWSDMLDGEVLIDIVAPGEPYVVFDYALLDTEPISNPAPGAIILAGLGVSLTGWLRRRRAF